MPAGPLGGVLGLLTAGVVFAVVMATAYEFARITASYDYRSFCKQLLGRGWLIYEVAYVALVVLILAVVGSAAGTLVREATGLPVMAGTIGMMTLVGVLTFYGSSAIATVLSLWSVLLYLVYLVLFAETFASQGANIVSALGETSDAGAAPLAGLRYAGYNISLPSVLFCMTLLTTRRQTLGAGAMTGLIAIVPALLFFVAMLAYYPQIADEPVPALYVIGQLSSPWLNGVFQLVVFGTFVETGAGVLHSINERIDVQAHEGGHHLPRWARPAIAAALLLVSIYGATAIGIVDLIASGYGMLSWVFIVVLIVPLLTAGTWRIIRTGQAGTCPQGQHR